MQVSFLGVYQDNLQLLTISYEVTFAHEEVQANAGILAVKALLVYSNF